MSKIVKSTPDYKKISLEETLKFLDTTSDGRSDTQGRNRLTVFGPNEIVEKKKNHLLEFLLRYWGPMPWLFTLGIDFPKYILFKSFGL